MNYTGEKVKHVVLGNGVIEDFSDNCLYVHFASKNTTIKMLYPDSFEKYLTFENEELNAKVQEELSQKKQMIQKKADEEKKKQNELTAGLRQIKVGGRKNKLEYREPNFPSSYVPKKNSTSDLMNVAFKCTYCDGGKTSERIGFDGCCSDENIKYNIEHHRDWCNTGQICIRRYTREITRSEYLGLVKTVFPLCYECKMLRDWKACAGTINHGKRAGTRIRMKNTGPDKLTILTTRLPNSKEAERIIFAVFMIGLNYEGDEREEGFVYSNPGYRLELKPDEAKKMLFWNYYSNRNTDAASWGTGLFRYVDDETTMKLLKDIIEVKRNTPDEEKALQLYNYYLTANKIKEG